MMRWMLAIFCALFFLFGCTEDSPKKELTQRQRDSVLSESKLPGARTVKKAIEISDSSKARAGRIDDVSK